MLQKTKNTHTHKQTTVKHSIITKNMMQSITREASTLGLTPREYLQITTEVARNIRESFGKGKEQDALQLLKIVQNPFFTVILRSVAETFMKNISTDKDKNEEKIETETQKSQAVPMTPTSPAPQIRQTPPPYQIYELW